MSEVQLTDEFDSWLSGLRDRTAQMRIVARIRRKRRDIERATELLKQLEPDYD